jgi:hypothetical protein
VHDAGECELLDTDIGGLAVHIAARILGHAGAGEILVSRTVRDLVVGSGTGFEAAAPSSCVACPAPGNSWPPVLRPDIRNSNYHSLSIIWGAGKFSSD